MAERKKALPCLDSRFFDCEGGGCAYTIMLNALGNAITSLKLEGHEITETFTIPSISPLECQGSNVGPYGCGERVKYEIYGR